MIGIERSISKIPSGVLSLVAVLLASFSPPLILVVMAVCLVFAEITLGYIKQQSVKNLLRDNRALKKKIRELDKVRILNDEITQSMNQLGHKVLPLWSQLIRENVELSTVEIDRISQHFTETIEQLNRGGEFTQGQLMEGEYQLIVNKVMEHAKHGIQSAKYQEHASQIMRHLEESMIDLSFKCEGKQAINIDSFLQINSASYTTTSEREAYQTHTGQSAIEEAVPDKDA